MSRQLTPQEQEQVRQVESTMALSNMHITQDIYQDMVDYITGEKTEQEVLDGIAARVQTHIDNGHLHVDKSTLCPPEETDEFDDDSFSLR